MFPASRCIRRAVKAGLAFRAVARLGIARAAAVLSRRAEVGRGVGAALGAEGSRVALRVAEGLTRVAGVPPRGAGQRRGADVASGAVRSRIAGGARVLPDASRRAGGVGSGRAGTDAARDVLLEGATFVLGRDIVSRLARREVDSAAGMENAVSSVGCSVAQDLGGTIEGEAAAAAINVYGSTQLRGEGKGRDGKRMGCEAERKWKRENRRHTPPPTLLAEFP